MNNTGIQYTTRWGYGIGSGIESECRLIKPAGDSFYSDAEVMLLSVDEYSEAFDNTVAYMRDSLGWMALPRLEDSCRENWEACPLGSSVLPIDPKWPPAETVEL